MDTGKIVSIVVVLFVVTVFGGCFPTEYDRIGDIEFNAVEKGKYDNKVIRRIEGKLLFEISYKLELDRVAQVRSWGLGNRCYATSRNEVLDDGLLWETFSLSFDRPFVYKGDTIQAFSNFFEMKEIKSEIMIYNDSEDEHYYNTLLDFSSAFLQDAQLKGEYEVVFSCKSQRDVTFKKKIAISF